MGGTNVDERLRKRGKGMRKANSRLVLSSAKSVKLLFINSVRSQMICIFCDLVKGESVPAAHARVVLRCADWILLERGL